MSSCESVRLKLSQNLFLFDTKTRGICCLNGCSFQVVSKVFGSRSVDSDVGGLVKWAVRNNNNIFDQQKRLC